MVDIRREKIRARISVGGYMVETPDIKSFTVSRSRAQMVSTMDATMEVDPDFSNSVDIEDAVWIEAGADGTYNRIFTGYITAIKVSPAWDKKDKIIVNISGRDVFYRLEGKGFSRRNPFRSTGRWVGIRGIVKKGHSLDVEAGGRPTKTGVKSQPDLHLTGTTSPNVITTPDIIDLAVTNPRQVRAARPSIQMEPDIAYINAGDEVNVMVSETRNPQYDYGTYYTAAKTNVADYWKADDPAYCNITPDQTDPRKARIKVSKSTFPGVSFGVTFYSDKVDLASGRELTGRVVFMSVIPHTHESMMQGGPAFGTFA